jgi:glycosyltransferase involved in cell wall biosynthesis
LSLPRLSILHFSMADVTGGSARSAYRIHTGLRSRGHRSRMLVGFRSSQDPDVQSVSASKALHLADRCANKVGGHLGFQYSFVPSSLRTARHPWLRQADVIQLFNTHGGYFAQGLLPKLARHAPLVWRLSDFWPFTGHCAYPGACNRWLSGCGSCPDLQTYPAIARDRTAELFKLKKRLYAGLPLTIVAPSSWIEQQARRSPLLGDLPVRRIPNGLDGTAYVPHSRAQAREQLGLPRDAKVILFAAHVLDDNPRKGGDVLLRALASLGPQEGWVLALMGEGGGSWLGKAPIPVHLLGFHSDASSIARCYAAADVVAIPSVLENLPNTLIEALACGRAVVASDCGGMSDGVIHARTGLLTSMGDAVALAEGLKTILTLDERRATMEREARELFEREFSSQRELDRIEALYAELALQWRDKRGTTALAAAP